MKFVRILDKINQITSQTVEFSSFSAAQAYEKKNNCHVVGAASVSLNRVHDKQVIWKLKEDGIYVLRPYAEAYGLRFI